MRQRVLSRMANLVQTSDRQIILQKKGTGYKTGIKLLWGSFYIFFCVNEVINGLAISPPISVDLVVDNYILFFIKMAPLC